ncbi:NIPSNAP family containing protein [Micromonospora sp. NPDC007208]|uniref:NIPSNAP family containing protein n=1 Tax=Micromonospora sp. NPDC007208 TaxID=3364236 RepID=UPI0036738226
MTEKLGRWGRRIVRARGCRSVPKWRWDVTTQLRIYTVRPGRLDAWVAAWRTLVVPLRQRFGFEISGSWVDVERQQHIWLVSHPGPQSFEEANVDYWRSPERIAMGLDPHDYLLSEEIRTVDPVL